MDGNQSAQMLPVISPALRKYLYFTAAVTGGAIMIVEILGAKMLAPYVGTSHFVWVAQIAVTLVALALGYYVGGWLADRSVNLGRMYAAIVAAALYLCLAVWLIEPVANWCLRFNLAAGSLLASTFLFLVPLALLAMVGPFFVRALTVSVGDVGGNVGRLTAISTLGSVVGTVLIGYVLLPLLPNSVTMGLTAALLMAVTGGYFLARSFRAAGGVLLASVVGLSSVYVAGLRPPPFAGEEIYRRNSQFGQLQVVDARGSGTRFGGAGCRYYLNDFLMQNVYDLAAKKSPIMFNYMLEELARSYANDVYDVLCIGMGVGIVPMRFARERAKVDVVEINPAVVPLAQRYFDFRPDLMRVIIDDGRHHLNCTTNRYDAVLLDAFLGDSSPTHLMTREAFESVRRILKPGGVLVIHSWGNLKPGRDFVSASLEKTLKAVFPSVRVHHDPGERGIHAVFFVASDQPSLKLARQPDWEQVHPHCRAQVATIFAGVGTTDPEHGIVLTDNFNPAEFYDAVNHEEIRRIIVADMRAL